MTANGTLKDPWFFLATGFGSGLARRAPGTAGSLVALPLYWLLVQAGPLIYLLLVALGFAFGVYLCDRVSRRMGVKDPACIVWDEFVGLWISLCFLPDGWYWLIAGFLLFRLFDILKPWPVSYFDREFAGGLGIMLDDVAAGVYALAIIQLAAWLLTIL
jgi:phosphatidylglycerophosphatase A